MDRPDGYVWVVGEGGLSEDFIIRISVINFWTYIRAMRVPKKILRISDYKNAAISAILF